MYICFSLIIVVFLCIILLLISHKDTPHSLLSTHTKDTWTYYEAGNKGESALEMRESLARWAQMLPRQPPVHVYNTGVLSNVKKGEYELAKHMSEFGYNAFYMRSGYLNGGFDYDAAKLNGVDHFGWGHVGDGYHNVTRYGENESSTERNESLGTVMRNWQ